MTTASAATEPIAPALSADERPTIIRGTGFVKMSEAQIEASRRMAPSVTARVDRMERFRTGTQFGDMTAPQLAQIIAKAKKGDVEQWAEFCEYAISSSEHLQSLYTTRITRITQADYQIIQSPFGNQALAKAARDFVDEQFARIENWDAAFRSILHAIAIGYSANEMVWAQDKRLTNYVKRIEHRHGRRFRYGPQWQLRLFDRGARSGADQYGEILDPARFIVHQHQELAGYPAVGGVMMASAWPWLFSRWVEKLWIGDVEKFASPFVHAEVKENTKKEVREELLASLESLSSDHAAVVEEGTKIVVNAAAAAASGEKHEAFVSFHNQGLTKLWLGSSDMVESGPNGARGATETRASATMDPRMVADGKLACTTIRESLFTQLIRFNVTKIRVRAGLAANADTDAIDIPIPIMRMKTANDEVKVDAEQAQKEGSPSARVPEVGREEAPTPKPADAPPAIATAPGESVQQQALNGSQGETLKQTAIDVYEGTLPRKSAIAFIKLMIPDADMALIEEMIPEFDRATRPAPEPAAAPVMNAEPARKRRSPKAPAAGEPRQQVIGCCEPTPVTPAPKRSRITSSSAAVRAALAAPAK